MARQEFCNWIALCNALKFINNASISRGRYIDENEIVYKDMMNYIGSVSGDIAVCIEKARGIPFKYSLTCNSEDSKQTEDINYDFLG